MRSLTLLFPVSALAFSFVAYCFPDYFTPMKSAILPLLMVIMFGMGMTLTKEDFNKDTKKTKDYRLGVAIAIYSDALSGLWYCQIDELIT